MLIRPARAIIKMAVVMRLSTFIRGRAPRGQFKRLVST